MKIFALLAAVLLSPIGQAADVKPPEIYRCVQGANPGDPTCQAIAKYLAKHPLHWEGDQWFLEDEWAVRQSLEKQGIRLAADRTPADYVKHSARAGEVLLVFEGWNKWEDDKTPNQTRAWSLGTRAGLSMYGRDPKMFPIHHADIYLKAKGAKGWEEAGRVEADSLLDTQGKWFEDRKSVRCPNTKFVFAERAGVCFTNFYSQDWPEIHVFVDHLASTGVLLETHALDGKKYRKVLENFGTYRRQGKEVYFFQAVTGEGLDDVWHYAHGGYVWRYGNFEFQQDEKLTKQHFNFLPVKVGSRPGYPSAPGRFRRNDRKEQVEMLN